MTATEEVDEVIGIATKVSTFRVRRTAAAGGAVLMVAAALAGFSAPASAERGDWGHTPGADLYNCQNPSVCGKTSRSVGEGWVQIWCWSDAWFIRWFKARAWTGKEWEEGWIVADQVDQQPSVPGC